MEIIQQRIRWDETRWNQRRGDETLREPFKRYMCYMWPQRQTHTALARWHISTMDRTTSMLRQEWGWGPSLMKSTDRAKETEEYGAWTLAVYPYTHLCLCPYPCLYPYPLAVTDPAIVTVSATATWRHLRNDLTWPVPLSSEKSTHYTSFYLLSSSLRLHSPFSALYFVGDAYGIHGMRIHADPDPSSASHVESKYRTHLTFKCGEMR